jgi:hypothetical protein
MTTSSNALPRVFKSGTTIITEAPEMRGLSIDQVKQLLKTTYPEIQHQA